MKKLKKDLELLLNEEKEVRIESTLWEWKEEDKENSIERIGNWTMEYENLRKKMIEQTECEIEQMINESRKEMNINLGSKEHVEILLSGSYDYLKNKPGMKSKGLSLEAIKNWEEKDKVSINEKKILDEADIGKNSFRGIIEEIISSSVDWNLGRQVWIPKDDKSKRELVIAPWKDRIVQGALELPLKQKYSWWRSRNSIGYIPRVSREDVVQDWIEKEIWKEGWVWIVEADIKNCFPSIPFRAILASIRKWDTVNHKWNTTGSKILLDMLKKGYISEDGLERIKPIRGTPQGNVWSPVLANIVMNELDRYMMKNHKEKLYVRFADDFIVGVKDQETAENLKMELTEWVRKEIGLELNQEKTLITNWTKDPISYLGYNIRSLEKELVIKPDIKRRIKALKQKLILKTESTEGELKWTKESFRRNWKDLETLWSGVLVGNTYDKEDIIISKLIKPEIINRFGENGWYERLTSEEWLEEIGISTIYPELFITKNHIKYKKVWEENNTYLKRKEKWSLEKMLMKALNSQWLALELSHNWAGNRFGTNWKIISKSTLNKNSTLKFMRKELINGLIADPSIVEKKLLLKMNCGIVSEYSEVMAEYEKSVLLNLWVNVLIAKTVPKEKRLKLKTILKEKAEVQVTNRIKISRIIFNCNFIILPESWGSSLTLDKCKKIRLACWFISQQSEID